MRKTSSTLKEERLGLVTSAKKVLRSPDKPSGAYPRVTLRVPTPTTSAMDDAEVLKHVRGSKSNAHAMPPGGAQPTLYTPFALDKTGKEEGSGNADAALNGNGKRRSSTEALPTEDTMTKRLRKAGPKQIDTSFQSSRTSTAAMQAHPEPPEFGRYPITALLESRHAEQRLVSTEKEQRDAYGASSLSGAPSDIDELEDLPDTQTTLVESDPSSQNPQDGDDWEKTVDRAQQGGTDDQASLQYASPSNFVAFSSSTLLNDTYSSEPARRPAQQKHAVPPHAKSLVPPTGPAPSMATTGDLNYRFLGQKQQIPGLFFNNPYIPTPSSQSTDASQNLLQSKKKSPLQRRSSEIPPSGRPTSPARRRQSAPYPPVTTHGPGPISSSPSDHRSEPPQVLNPPAPTRDTGLPPGVQGAYSSHLPLLRQRSESGMPILYQAYRTFWLPRNSNYFVLADPTHPARTQFLNASTPGDSSSADVQVSNPSFFYWDPLPLQPSPMQCLSPGCSHSLEHDGFAKVLKKVASQSGEADASSSGFWLVAARYKCEHCKASVAGSGKKYNSIIAWDPRLLAKLSPALRAEFPAVEVQKRFYALESMVPPEYRLDSQTFLVSVTKSSRQSGPPTLSSTQPPQPDPLPMALSAAQSPSASSHSLQGSSLSVLYSGRTVDVDPNPRLGALRPLGSASVWDRMPPSQPPIQITHPASVLVDRPAQEGLESRPPGFHREYSMDLTVTPPQEPAAHDVRSREQQPEKTPIYWRSAGSPFPSMIGISSAQSSRPTQPHRGSNTIVVEQPNKSLDNTTTSLNYVPAGSLTIIQAYMNSNNPQKIERRQSLQQSVSARFKDRSKDPTGTPRMCMKCMRTSEECTGYVGSQHCKFPCAGCGRVDCSKRHTLRSGNQCMQNHMTSGSMSDTMGQECDPGASGQAFDEFYLDSSYFEEGVDEAMVDETP